MLRTRIKICGITNADDALMAAEAGADAIGMVFHVGSARGIGREVAAQILAVLPPVVTPVGLFVDAPSGEILDTCRALGLGHVQLHGHETPADLEPLKNLRVLKAVHVEASKINEQLDEWRRPIANLCGLILDTASKTQAGGTGIANDWGTLRQCREVGGFSGLVPIILAGGLTPETVGQVVRDLRPYAVDVSSGVEVVRGKKDGAKIAAFIRAVAQADAR